MAEVHAQGTRGTAQSSQATEHADTIAAIRAHADHQLSRSQRVVEHLTANVGRPSTIAMLLAMIAAWVSGNCLVSAAGGAAPDPAPFFWLQGVVALYAALVGTFVLATQNREKRHGEQRAYLELQVNLLAEKKTAKVIELLEELRRDLPAVRDRVDRQADAMQLPVDTTAVMSVLEETMDNGTDATMAIGREEAREEAP